MIINYNDIHLSEISPEISSSIFKSIDDFIRSDENPFPETKVVVQENNFLTENFSRYTIDSVSPFTIRSEVFLSLHYLSYVLSNDFKEKKILDIGCGSNSNIDNLCECFGHYQPWLCRVLHFMGANPIGIDIGDLSGEIFESYSKDLSTSDALGFIPDHSIDIVHAKQFFTSPYLMTVSGKDRNEMESLLEPQIFRVLKEDGYYIRMNF